MELTSLVQREIGTLFRISLTLHHLNKSFERHYKLSLVQLYTLTVLRQLPAVTLNALAYEVGVKPSTLTQTIRRLLRKNYVLVMDDPNDSRKKIISLTRNGKDATEFVCKELTSFFAVLGGRKVRSCIPTAFTFLEFLEGVLSHSNSKINIEKRRPIRKRPGIKDCEDVNL